MLRFTVLEGFWLGAVAGICALVFSVDWFDTLCICWFEYKRYMVLDYLEGLAIYNLIQKCFTMHDCKGAWG
jgi:hypothetical protein